MRNKIFAILFALAAVGVASPVLAGPAEEAKVEAKAEEGKAEEAPKPEAKEEAKEAKEEAKEAAETKEGTDTPKAIETEEEAVEAAKDLYTAIRSGHWPLAVGLGIMLILFVVRKTGVLNKVPKNAMPWVAAVIGIASYIALALTTDGANVWEALSSGFMSGAAAVGFWELVFKKFLGGKREEAKEEAKEEEEPKESA